MYVRGGEHFTVSRDHHAGDGRLMPPELRELTMGQSPQVTPGEAAGVKAVGLGLDVVEDILGQLDPATNRVPDASAETLRVVVPVGQPPALFGKAMLFLGLLGLPVRARPGSRVGECAAPAN